MINKNVLKVLLVIWALWHLVFGVLATFLPELGARLSGWRPDGSWDADMISLSTQYGMAMILLSLVFLFGAIDPVRYFAVIWIVVAELFLGLAYAVYIYLAIGGITVAQMTIQGLINIVFIGVFLFLGARLRQSGQLSQ